MKKMMELACGVIILTIVLMIVLVVRTEVIKDVSTTVGERSYSLSRTQLLLWTTIIFCCFIYLIGEKDFVIDSKVTLGKTALILLGVSAGTAVVGKTIDESDKKNLANGTIRSMQQNEASSGFWLDILSDKDGISMLRFQNVMFTAALMIGFVIHVASKGVMPEFDDTLLILSGISSGGYLGVKMNENK